MGASFNLCEFPGRTAEIVQFDLPEMETQRLKSLGVFEGQSIELRKAGNFMIFTAAGSRVAIANAIACRITVRASEEAA